jgi:small subunit ribosomal protein S19e
MAIIFDVQQNELITKTAEKLKEVKEITPPTWSIFVKTGAHKERPPIKEDWWYTRCAAVLRSVSILGPVGVNKLRVKYGGRKNRGMKPEKFVRGSGNILRKSLQQLEKADLIKQVTKDNHKGRVITPKGQSLLAQIAQSIKKEKL